MAWVRRLLRYLAYSIAGLLTLLLLCYVTLPYWLNPVLSWALQPFSISELQIDIQRPGWRHWSIPSVALQYHSPTQQLQIQLTRLNLDYQWSQPWPNLLRNVALQQAQIHMQQTATENNDTSSDWTQLSIPLQTVQQQLQAQPLPAWLPDITAPDVQIRYHDPAQQAQLTAQLALQLKPQQPERLSINGIVLHPEQPDQALTLQATGLSDGQVQLALQQQHNQLQFQLIPDQQQWQFHSNLQLDDSLWQQLHANHWLPAQWRIQGQLQYQMQLQCPNQNLSIGQLLSQWQLQGLLSSTLEIQHDQYGAFAINAQLETTQQAQVRALHFSPDSQLRWTAPSHWSDQLGYRWIDQPVQLSLQQLTLEQQADQSLQVQGALQLGSASQYPWQLNIALPQQTLWQQTWLPVQSELHLQHTLASITIPDQATLQGLKLNAHISATLDAQQLQLTLQPDSQFQLQQLKLSQQPLQLKQLSLLLKQPLHWSNQQSHLSLPAMQFKAQQLSWRNAQQQLNIAQLALQAKATTWPLDGTWPESATLHYQLKDLSWQQPQLHTPSLNLSGQSQLQAQQLHSQFQLSQQQQSLGQATLQLQLAQQYADAHYQFKLSPTQLKQWLKHNPQPWQLHSETLNITGQLKGHFNALTHQLQFDSSQGHWQDSQQHITWDTLQLQHKLTLHQDRLQQQGALQLHQGGYQGADNIRFKLLDTTWQSATDNPDAGAVDFQLSLQQLAWPSRKIAPKPLDVTAQGALRPPNISVKGTVQRLNKSLLQFQAHHQWQQQHGQAYLHSQIDDFKQWPKGLNDIVKGLEQQFSLQSGQWQLDSRMQWQHKDASAWQFSADTQWHAKQLQGRLMQLPFKGLQWQLTTLDPNQLHSQLAIQMAHLAAATPISNTQLQLQLQPLASPLQLQLQQLETHLLSGKVYSQPATLLLAEDWQLPLYIEYIDLSQLVTLFNQPGLEASGQLSGLLPLHVSAAQSVSIQQGELHNEGKGVIRYQPGAYEQALTQQHSGSQIAFAALSNFHYTDLKLQLDHNLKQQQRTHSRWLFSGHNPDFYDGFPVQFNLDLDAPLLQMLQAGLFSQKVESSVEDYLRQKMPGHE